MAQDSNLLLEILEILKTEQERSSARDLQVQYLIEDVKKLQKTIGELSKKQSQNLRKISDVNRLIIGKVGLIFIHCFKGAFFLSCVFFT